MSAKYQSKMRCFYRVLKLNIGLYLVFKVPPNDLKATSILFEYILIEIYVANMYFTVQIPEMHILRVY